MKNAFVLIGLLFLSFGLQASEKLVQCESLVADSSFLEARVFSDGSVRNLEYNLNPFWSLDEMEATMTVTKNPLLYAVNYPIIQHLFKYSGVKKEDIGSATLAVSVEKAYPEAKPSLETQLEIVSDDGAGVLYLEIKNKKGQMIGGSVFAGWGGFFENCKELK